MKLFYKKDYEASEKLTKKQRVRICELEIQNNTLKTEKEILEKQKKDFEDYNNLISECNKELKNEKDELFEDLQKEKQKVRLLNGSKGGFTKQINKLKKEKEELEIKLKESMTDKYLVKKIPSGKIANTIKTKIRHSISPSVQKYMKDQEREKNR